MKKLNGRHPVAMPLRWYARRRRPFSTLPAARAFSRCQRAVKSVSGNRRARRHLVASFDRKAGRRTATEQFGGPSFERREATWLIPELHVSGSFGEADLFHVGRQIPIV
jgi:hypothetical protein